MAAAALWRRLSLGLNSKLIIIKCGLLFVSCCFLLLIRGVHNYVVLVCLCVFVALNANAINPMWMDGYLDGASERARLLYEIVA